MKLPAPEPISTFLLAFPALISIINPITVAFVFREATLSRSAAERRAIARKVGLYSFIVIAVAL